MKIPKFTIFILIALIVIREMRRGYFKSFKKFRFRGLSILVVGALPLLFGLFFLDTVLYQTLPTLNQSYFKILAGIGGFLGRNINPWVLMIAGYSISSIFKSVRGCQIAFGSLFSAALSASSCHLFKFLFLRARPYAEEGPLSFFNLGGVLEDARAYQSFPSGDVAVVAGACAFLICAVKPIYLRLFLLSMPFMTGFARMYAARHWFSDVVASLVLGYLWGKSIWEWQKYIPDETNLEGGKICRSHRG